MSEGMTADPDQEGAHHVSGFYLKRLLALVADRISPESVAELLERAGETRPVAELIDFASWSSYGQFRRLLEAAVELLEATGPEATRGAVPITGGFVDPELVEVIHSLGSPTAILRQGAGTNPLIPIMRYELDEVGPHHWTIEEGFLEGFEPYPEFCAYTAGQYASISMMFGFPEGEVVEETCQCRGAPSCRFRIRWVEGDPAAARLEYLEVRAAMLEERLARLQGMVAELASDARPEKVLQDIVGSALRALGATRGVLALAPRRGAARVVLSEGYTPEEASDVADRLLGAALAEPARSVSPVASALRHYGVLAVDEQSMLFAAPAPLILDTYARLAAAALDSVEALEEARHEAATAQLLLELSTALSEAHTIDAVLARMEEAIPTLIDCDRVAILLDHTEGPGPGDGTCQVVASAGYPEWTEAELAARRFPLDHGEAADSAGIVSRSWSHVDTLASVSIPIVADGRDIGGIVIGVTSGPERLAVTPRLTALLRGLAAQASIAVSNTRLLDQIRFQARHDVLTGLPNRALILDSAERLLDRARVGASPIAVLFLDLDGFKEVNDLLGHAAGDELLRAVTHRLESSMRDRDSIGRLGGDEFIILLDGEATESRPELVAGRLLEAIRRPFVLPSVPASPVTVTASVGIAAGLRPSVTELIGDADSALYVAKASGKDRFVTFRPGMRTPSATDGHHARQPPPSDDRPVIDLRTGTTTTLRALIHAQAPPS
jgi:diguanylate cyclase (GGDEF)-like protein